jgi:hypothetical protein
MDYVIGIVWEFFEDGREYGILGCSLYWNLFCDESPLGA